MMSPARIRQALDAGEPLDHLGDLAAVLHSSMSDREVIAVVGRYRLANSIAERIGMPMHRGHVLALLACLTRENRSDLSTTVEHHVRASGWVGSYLNEPDTQRVDTDYRPTISAWGLCLSDILPYPLGQSVTQDAIDILDAFPGQERQIFSNMRTTRIRWSHICLWIARWSGISLLDLPRIDQETFVEPPAHIQVEMWKHITGWSKHDIEWVGRA